MKHNFEVETKNTPDLRIVTITIWCTMCKTKAQLQMDDIDLVLDAQAVEYKIQELCDAHTKGPKAPYE